MGGLHGWWTSSASSVSVRDTGTVESLDPRVPWNVCVRVTDTLSVEAGISLGWSQYAAAHVAIDRFGASAPGTEVLERFGFTPDHVASVAGKVLAD